MKMSKIKWFCFCSRLVPVEKTWLNTAKFHFHTYPLFIFNCIYKCNKYFSVISKSVGFCFKSYGLTFFLNLNSNSNNSVCGTEYQNNNFKFYERFKYF